MAGANQKVSNFPGVTVEVKSGISDNVRYIDYPGIYSLDPITSDEEVSVNQFVEGMQSENTVVVCVLDATRLERSLIVGLQSRELARKNNKRFIFALNMIDEIKQSAVKINIEELEKHLATTIVPVSAKTGENLDKLKEAIKNTSVGKLSKQITTSKEDIFRLSSSVSKTFLSNPGLLIKHQNRLDKIFLSSIWGSVIFVSSMLVLFQAIFTWSAPFMDTIENVISYSGAFVSDYISNQIARDFVKDALFGGCGSFLVFVPQIFILTFIISFLEDSGYLARASIFCHRIFSFFGLSGRSFIPFLSAHACAIPAIFAARTIASPKRRLLTMLTIPLLACSARLPVYALLISVLIPDVGFFGIIGLQGFFFTALYFLGFIMALLVSALLSNTLVKKHSDMPFVIELPPYRMPSLGAIALNAAHQSWLFVAKAGFIIFSVTVVVWLLGYFPNGAGHLSSSWLAKIGVVISPIFETVGLDWKFGVAIIASFLAREVFVGTLATLFGIESTASELLGLSDHLSDMSMASGMSLLVFYAIALQCVSTLAIIKKELGSYKTPVVLFIAYTFLAYILMLIVYNIL